MSFFDNFANGAISPNKRNQRDEISTPTEMKFLTASRKITKKDYLDTHLFYQERLNRCFSNKI